MEIGRLFSTTPILGWLFLVAQVVLMPAAIVYKRSRGSRDLEISDSWVTRAFLIVFALGIPLIFLEILAFYYTLISIRVVIILLGLVAFIIHLIAWGMAIYHGVKAWNSVVPPSDSDDARL